MIGERLTGIVPAMIAILLFGGTEALARDTRQMQQAALVYNLSKFVVWPDQESGQMAEERTGGNPENRQVPDGIRCTFCILGENKIDADLAKLAGTAAGDRKHTVCRLNRLKIPLNCQVLYISADMEAELSDILKKLERRPVFTVSDIPQFARRGGMVEIVSADERVFFHINLDAAKRAGLIIKAPLLQIATVIQAPLP